MGLALREALSPRASEFDYRDPEVETATARLEALLQTSEGGIGMPRGRKRTVESMRSELEALKKQIEMRELDEKRSQLTSSKEFRVVAKEINRLGLAGDEINELFQKPKEVVKRRKPSKRKGVKLKPKYRNPENPEQVWTGRGNRPRWVTAALERGLTFQDLLIESE